jgi:hypothetical protein
MDGDGTRHGMDGVGVGTREKGGLLHLLSWLALTECSGDGKEFYCMITQDSFTRSHFP